MCNGHFIYWTTYKRWLRGVFTGLDSVHIHLNLTFCSLFTDIECAKSYAKMAESAKNLASQQVILVQWIQFTSLFYQSTVVWLSLLIFKEFMAFREIYMSAFRNDIEYSQLLLHTAAVLQSNKFILVGPSCTSHTLQLTSPLLFSTSRCWNSTTIHSNTNPCLCVSIVASADPKVWARQTAEGGEGAVAEGAEENGRSNVTFGKINLYSSWHLSSAIVANPSYLLYIERPGT